MTDVSTTAILEDAHELASRSRALLALRCGQAAGPEGVGLAHALCDMLRDGDYPSAWPLMETVILMRQAPGCRRTAALRKRLEQLAERIAALEFDAAADDAIAA